jgi:hypothetical protein
VSPAERVDPLTSLRVFLERLARQTLGLKNFATRNVSFLDRPRTFLALFPTIRFEKRGRMRLKLFVFCAVCITLAYTACADTLRLKNGQVIYGQFIGRTPEGIQFAGPDGNPQIYPSQEVAALTFGPVPAPRPAPAPEMMTVPAGTIVLVQWQSWSCVFFQIESQLQLLVDLQIASSLPIIEEADTK